MESNLGLSSENIPLITAKLNKILASEYVLYAKLQAAHWNLESPDFFAMHGFLQQLYEELAANIDNIAERIRVFGVKVSAKLSDMINLSYLKESDIPASGSLDLVKSLVLDFEKLIKVLRVSVKLMTEDFKDDGTANFLTDLMQRHEKQAWLLRAHLK